MDTRTVRTVILVLGLIALATVIGGFILAFDGKAIPGELVAIGASASTGIIALLTRPPADAPQVARELAAAAPPPAPPLPDLGPLIDELAKVSAPLVALAEKVDAGLIAGTPHPAPDAAPPGP